jgi:hypothetical protein
MAPTVNYYPPTTKNGLSKLTAFKLSIIAVGTIGQTAVLCKKGERGLNG